MSRITPTYCPISAPCPHPAWTFTFSAKEKDSETGLSYFGSRYYNSDLSIWLNVDPMSDKYPSLSPYSYCANNPIKLVDPNGEEFIGAIIGVIVGAATEVVSQTIANGVENLSKGETFFKGWSKKNDLVDVGVSAAVGALDGLVPGAGKLIGELAGDLLKAAVDWKAENITNNRSGFRIVGISKDPKEFLCDLATNLATTGFCHASGLNKLDFERHSIHFSAILFETTMKGCVSGTFGSVNKIVKTELGIPIPFYKLMNPHVTIGDLLLEGIEF